MASTIRHDEVATRGGMSSGWGPVLSGAAAAFLTFAAFSALWLAIAASGAEWMNGAIAWFELATALGAALVGGTVTGRLQDGGRDRGAMRAFAAWGLVLVTGLVVGVPATTAIFAGATNLTLQAVSQGADVSQQLSTFGNELWSSFIIFAGGGILAAIAGAAAAPAGERVEAVEPEERRRPAARHDTVTAH